MFIPHPRAIPHAIKAIAAISQGNVTEATKEIISTATTAVLGHADVPFLPTPKGFNYSEELGRHWGEVATGESSPSGGDMRIVQSFLNACGNTIDANGDHDGTADFDDIGEILSDACQGAGDFLTSFFDSI
jgi:hypothetical protein